MLFGVQHAMEDIMLSCLLSAKSCCGIVGVLILLCPKAPRDHWTVYMFALPHFFGQESSVFGKSETVGTPGNQEKIKCNPWEDQTIPLSALFGLKVL